MGVKTGEVFFENFNKTVVAVLGTYGILATLFSMKFCGDGMVSFIVALICCFCFTTCMASPSLRRKFIVVFSVVYGILVVLFFSKAYNGFKSCVEDIRYFINNGYSSHRDRIIEDKLRLYEIGSDEEAFFFLFAILISFLVCGILVYIRNALAAVISILPLMLSYITVLIIPSVGAFILCLLYIYGAFTMEKNNHLQKNTWLILAITCVACVLSLIFSNPFNYRRPEVFVKLGNDIQVVIKYFFGESKLEANVDGLLQQITGNAEAGISVTNHGVLGKVGQVILTDNEEFTLYTEDVGENQYIPTFKSSYYDFMNNRWLDKSVQMDPEDEGFISPDFTDFKNNGVDFKKKIAGSVEAFDKNVYVFSYRAPFGPRVGSYSQDGYIAVVSRDMYSKFEKNSDYYKNEYDDNLKLIYDHRAIMEGIFGDVHIDGNDDVLNYIQLVQDYFSTNYKYTLSPGAVPAGREFLDYFMNTGKEGFCTYFATAGVMALRYAGIQARYVEGYMVPAYYISESEDGVPSFIDIKEYDGFNRQYDLKTVQVKKNMAHAWVEVYLDGYGWMPVEMTPAAVESITEVNSTNNSGQEIGNEEESSKEATQEETTAEESSEEDSTEATQEDTKEALLGTEDTGKKDINLSVIFAAILCIAIAFAVINNIFRIRKINNKLINGSIVEVVEVMEKLFDAIGKKRPASVPYEIYVDILEVEDNIFIENHYREIVARAMEERYGLAGEYEDKGTYNRYALMLHNNLISAQPFIKKIFIKYILVR